MLLNKWLGEGTDEAKEKRAVTRLERMEDPGTEVGWSMWMRIAGAVEREYGHLSQLLLTMQTLSVWFTYEVRLARGTRHHAAQPMRHTVSTCSTALQWQSLPPGLALKWSSRSPEVRHCRLLHSLCLSLSPHPPAAH